MEWWFTSNKVNSLQGIPGDEDNPAILADDAIATFLVTYPEAVNSCLRILPTLLPEEQERINLLLRQARAVGPTLDPFILSDRIQNQWNKRGIRTAGWTTRRTHA